MNIEPRELVFLYAKTALHPTLGKCYMMVYRVYSAEKNTLREPQYVVEYYQGGRLVETSY